MMLWVLLFLLSCGLGHANLVQNTQTVTDDSPHVVFNPMSGNQQHTLAKETEASPSHSGSVVKRELPRSKNTQLELDLVVFHLGFNKTIDDTATSLSPPEPTSEPTSEASEQTSESTLEPTTETTTEEPTSEDTTVPTTEPTTPTNPPKGGQKIVITTNGEIESPGIAFNNKVYFASRDQNVYEYDPATGEQKIVIKASSAFYTSGAVFNDKLYFGAYNGNVYEYDPATGQQAKKFELVTGVKYCTTVLNGKLYLTTAEKGVYELDLVNGQQKQILTNCHGSSYCGDFEDGIELSGKLYFSSNYKVYEYDPGTGKSGSVLYDPFHHFYRGIVLNGFVYFPSSYRVYKYNPIDGAPTPTTFVHSNGGIALNGKLYLRVDNSKSIFECNPMTGRELNVMNANSTISSNGVALNDKVYFGSYGEVHEYDPVTEQHKVVITTDGDSKIRSRGVTLNGKLYIGSDDYNVYEYDPAGN